MTRKFEHFAARREQVPVWLALIGASGSGKTYSALRLATGMQKVLNGKIWLVDTEARRALHYADQFSFEHVPFGEPFHSLDYLEAVKHCVAHRAQIVIIDSMSHEHEGAGGYLSTQESELQRMAGDDWGKRERVKMAAWIKPSALRNCMLQGLMQLNTSIIFCFRAKERIKPMPGADGKIVPRELGWCAIGGESLIYEMTASCLLPPRGMGIPEWNSNYAGERACMKLPRQFAGLLNKGELDESIGENLAKWASGIHPGEAVEVGTADRSYPAELDREFFRAHDMLAGAAEHGAKVLSAAWGRLSAREQKALKGLLDEQFKPRAHAVA